MEKESNDYFPDLDGIVLLIMNCEKYTFKSLKQKETWLQDLKLPYYHVIGDPHLEDDYIFHDKKQILFVKTKDDYNSLPKKVISAYEAVKNRFCDLRYILKTDDDQMLQSDNPYQFFLRIATMLKKAEMESFKIHYSGKIVNVDQAYLSQYHRIHPELPMDLPILPTKYCSGRFYILSIEAIEDLLKKKNYIEKEFLEDYAIGYYLDDNYKSNIKHLPTDLFFKDFDADV